MVTEPAGRALSEHFLDNLRTVTDCDLESKTGIHEAIPGVGDTWPCPDMRGESIKCSTKYRRLIFKLVVLYGLRMML